MTQHSQTDGPQVEVLPAAFDEAPILANLLELYIHDFSEFHHVEIGDDGRFGYPPLPLYWSEPDRYPFLIKVDGKLAGLVFVKQGTGMLSAGAVWDVAEFFIIRGYRRLGIGSRVAHEVWKRFPGQWQVRVMQTNDPARNFWARAISTFVGEVVRSVSTEKGGDCWEVFCFASGTAQYQEG